MTLDTLAASLDPELPARVGIPAAAGGSGQTCQLHASHSPANLTLEFHHVVPVAWQLLWQPAGEGPDPGLDPDGRGHLWDARGEWCCPTGHRNVHYWIVRLMKAHAAGTVAKLPRSSTTATAGVALERFTAVGGSLDQLVAAHEWGQV